MILVTSYKDPDLDGTACSYAYAELLNYQGTEATAAVFGTPHREAQFVINKFSITPLESGEKLLKPDSKVVLTDASEPLELPNPIDASQVVEIIDHRETSKPEKFVNANSQNKIQIEIVGAAATLVAERFKKINLNPSKKAAILLQLAIVSNTFNFQHKQTTDRDHDMYNWLQSITNLSKDVEREMFEDKSKIKVPLIDVFIEDLKRIHEKGKRYGIAQLEILNVEKFVSDNLTEIKKALLEMKEIEKLDYSFLNCVDLEGGPNTLVVADPTSEEIVAKAMDVTFVKGVAQTKKMIIRKEMVPFLLKEI